MKYNIRFAKKEEIETVAELAAKAFEGITLYHLLEKYGVRGQKRWEERKKDEIRHFAENNPQNILVTEVNEKIVGFVSFSINTADSIGTVCNNGVDPAYGGKGIGTAQVMRVIEIFKEKGLKYAQVLGPVEGPARRMYEKNGFEIIMKQAEYMRKL